MLEVIILLLRVSLGCGDCGGLGEQPRPAKWRLPACALWRCWEGAEVSPGPGAEQSCDTLSIPISHFPRAHFYSQRKHFATSRMVPFLGCCDTRMAQSPPAVAHCQAQSGTGPGPSLLASYSSISCLSHCTQR